MRVRKRRAPDPNGRAVDVYPLDVTINVITLKARFAVDNNLLLATVLDTLRVIQKMSITRLRDRDFSIFICHWEAYGELSLASAFRRVSIPGYIYYSKNG